MRSFVRVFQHGSMGRAVLVLLLLALSTPAFADTADDEAAMLMSERWHDVPMGRQLSSRNRIAEIRLTEPRRLHRWSRQRVSNDMLGLRFDGRIVARACASGPAKGSTCASEVDSDRHFTAARRAS